MDAINAAIAQAKNAAADVLPPAAPAPALQTQTYAAPAPAAPAQKLSLMDVADAARPTVDHYLKVNASGILIGKDVKNPQDEIEVELVLTEAQFFWGVRENKNYRRSIDRVTEEKTGAPWASVVAECRRLDTKCKGDYKAADIPMTLVNDVKTLKGDAVLAKAGAKVGYTTSITGFYPFEELVKNAVKAGQASIKLRGKLKHDPKSKDSENWGIILFQDFVPVQ